MIGKVIVFILKQIGNLRWQFLLILILWQIHNLQVIAKCSSFKCYFIVHILHGCVLFAQIQNYAFF